MNENKTLVIIPTYNEKANIEAMLAAVLKQSENLDVLIVDDGSPDGTAALVKNIMKTEPRVYIIERAGKLGLGTAYLRGFKWALARQYAYIIEMDADFSHNPTVIPILLQKIKEADVVIGSRYIKGGAVEHWTWFRRLLSRGAGIYTKLLTGLPLADPTSGFKCFRRTVLEHINLNAIRSDGYGFQIETMHAAWQKKFHLKEIPITFSDRRNGASKMSWRIAREAFWLVLRLAFQRSA